MLSDTSRVAFLSVLLAGAFALSVEALVLNMTEPTVALWMLPTHVGMGAPLVLLGALVGAVAAACWATLLRESLPTPLSLLTWVVSTPVVICIWVVTSTLVTMK